MLKAYNNRYINNEAKLSLQKTIVGCCRFGIITNIWHEPERNYGEKRIVSNRLYNYCRELKKEYESGWKEWINRRLDKWPFINMDAHSESFFLGHSGT